MDLKTIRIPGAESAIMVDGEFTPDEIRTNWEALVSRRDFRVRLSPKPFRSPHVFSTQYGLDANDPLLCRLAAVAEHVWPRPIKLDHGNLTLTFFGQTTTIHADSLSGAEFRPAAATLLYYANPSWDPEWHGETLFYADRDVVGAVLPKPGRIVVFDAAIEHAATPPTRLCYDPRAVVIGVFK